MPWYGTWGISATLRLSLALAGKSLAADAIAQAEAAASTPQDYENLEAAQAFLADAQNLLAQSNFLSALRFLKHAYDKADAVIN